MQCWLRFHLLNAVVWMALTSHAAEKSFCTEGCSSYNIAGIALPVDDIQHNISVWQEEDSSMNFHGRRTETLGRKWYSITTIPHDKEICIVSPGLLEEPGYCRAPDKFVDITVYSKNSLWSLHCNDDLCACQHHRLIALRIGKELVSKVFWWPNQNISRLVVALFLDSNLEKVTTFKVPTPPKWHDFAIGGRTRGFSYHLTSDSLNVSDRRNGQRVWIYGINDDGDKIPSYFALGCDGEPTEYPGEVTVDNNRHQRIIVGLYLALGALLLVLLVAAVLIRRFKSRLKDYKTDLALESCHNVVPLEHRTEDLGNRVSEDDHEYSYIDVEALRIQLESERVEGVGPRSTVRDSVDRRSIDNHEYCYIDTEALRTQLEREKRERRRAE